MSEPVQAVKWIISTAKADTALAAVATGGFWHQAADIGVVAPYFLCVMQSGNDTDTANAHRLFSRMLWQIVMVGPDAQYDALGTGADRIDALFGSARSVALSPSGGVLECWRTQPIAYSELPVNGKPWSRLGGLYQIDLQAS